MLVKPHQRLSALALIALFAACSGCLPVRTYQIQIVDADTGAPLESSKIDITQLGTWPNRFFTVPSDPKQFICDLHGQAVLPLKINGASRYYKVFVLHPGYYIVDGTLYPGDGRCNFRYFACEPRNYGTVFPKYGANLKLAMRQEQPLRIPMHRLGTDWPDTDESARPKYPDGKVGHGWPPVQQD